MLHRLAWVSVFAIGSTPFAALADKDDTGASGSAPFSVTVDQSTLQADPTHISPVSFTVVFSTAIDPATFTASDMKITGTSSGAIAAPPTTLDNITWDVSVFATSPGTIIATLPADAVTDLALNANASSTSTDNLAFLISILAHGRKLPMHSCGLICRFWLAIASNIRVTNQDFVCALSKTRQSEDYKKGFDGVCNLQFKALEHR